MTDDFPPDEDFDEWRVGRKLGRTLYLDDKLMGIMDDPAVAAQIVSAMNMAHMESELMETNDRMGQRIAELEQEKAQLIAKLEDATAAIVLAFKASTSHRRSGGGSWHEPERKGGMAVLPMCPILHPGGLKLRCGRPAGHPDFHQAYLGGEFADSWPNETEEK